MEAYRVCYTFVFLGIGWLLIVFGRAYGALKWGDPYRWDWDETESKLETLFKDVSTVGLWAWLGMFAFCCHFFYATLFSPASSVMFGFERDTSLAERLAL